MKEPITSFVGLDVHVGSIAVGVAPPGRQEPHFVGTVAPQWSTLSKALGRLGKAEALQIVYEAGPCGYTLARQLRAHGYRCEVIAPAKIARRPGDRIKTDRRDALLLARAARAGELVSVTIPDERDEALRDLSRAREDAVRARLKARQQLKALLLRHGRRYTGRSSWTEAHERTNRPGLRFGSRSTARFTAISRSRTLWTSSITSEGARSTTASKLSAESSGANEPPCHCRWPNFCEPSLRVSRLRVLRPTISEPRRRQPAYGWPAQSAEPVSSNGLNSLIPGRRKSFSFPVATVRLCRIAIAAM